MKAGWKLFSNYRIGCVDKQQQVFVYVFWFEKYCFVVLFSVYFILPTIDLLIGLSCMSDKVRRMCINNNEKNLFFMVVQQEMDLDFKLLFCIYF